MGIWTEGVSSFATLGLLLLGAYTFLRSLRDKRDEKTADLESRTNHIETFLEIIHQEYRRWRK